MKSTVEPLEGNKVKLSVEVDEQEFEKAIDDAFRKIAREVRIPGFRPGKAPRKVLEARIGKQTARVQALNDAIPDYFAQAVVEHDVDVIAAPEIDIVDGQEHGAVAFDAVVEVRPQVTVPGYAGLRVAIPSPTVTSDEIDAQLERLRAQFGELAAVDRPAAAGDYVTIDIAGSQDGEPLEGLTADDYLYQVGSGLIVPELDEQLRGAKVGEIFEFDAPHPSGELEGDLHFRVLVKEIKERQLPELDDAFASEASEFDTLDELRADYATRIGTVKKARASMALREKVGEALAELVEDEIPEALVTAEMRERLNDLLMRLQAQGMGLERWLELSGRTQEQLLEELRQTATVSAKVDLALRAVADAEGLEATEEDLDAEYEAAASRLGVDPAKMREEFARGGQEQAVRSDIKKRKALDWLVERVEIVDEEGHPIDRADLEYPADEPTDHDGESEAADTDTHRDEEDDS
ncbi:trigger factor [Rhabdothermincola sediminis]|uniref:trigger factor n=1 Tax=Rhabdothermincola sediminis TaxID=2751370 RepID=UPI001AA0AA4A|nr:trigger factor [Rhabdothermincola sediminis]